MSLILADTSLLTTVRDVKLSVPTYDYEINTTSCLFPKKKTLKRNLDNFNLINIILCKFINSI